MISAASSTPPSWKPELWVFIALIAFLNVPQLLGSFPHTLIFLPAATWDGEWWRLFTHPFVHATWYHLLLDGAAFLLLYRGLMEPSIWRRLAFVAAASLGSVAVACAASDVALNGLCGLSGVAHGLMAVSALEMMTIPRASTRRLGWLCFVLVVGKAAIEVVLGKMFFTWLHFGMMGEPVAASHAGGILGSLTLALLFKGCGQKEWGTKRGAARRVGITLLLGAAEGGRVTKRRLTPGAGLAAAGREARAGGGSGGEGRRMGGESFPLVLNHRSTGASPVAALNERGEF